MFSILIPTWNNFLYLKTCIESLQEHSGYNHQILVHVNEGKDESIAWLQEQKISYTHSSENIGICKALNLLAAKATAPYLVYMNDDMYALPQWDAALIKKIKAIGHENFYLSATMIEPTKGPFNCMIAPHFFGELNGNFNLAKLLDFHKHISFDDWNGASWPPSLVSKANWDAVGGYSESFSPGLYSDPDFSMKLWQLGIRDFIGVGSSRVYHFQSKTLHRVKLNNGRKQFKRKWGISAAYFYKNYLKIGGAHQGSLPEIKKNFSHFWATIKAKLSAII